MELKTRVYTSPHPLPTWGGYKKSEPRADCNQARTGDETREAIFLNSDWCASTPCSRRWEATGRFWTHVFVLEEPLSVKCDPGRWSWRACIRVLLLQLHFTAVSLRRRRRAFSVSLLWFKKIDVVLLCFYFVIDHMKLINQDLYKHI